MWYNMWFALPQLLKNNLGLNRVIWASKGFKAIYANDCFVIVWLFY